jgi:hypothetical protein
VGEPALAESVGLSLGWGNTRLQYTQDEQQEKHLIIIVSSNQTFGFGTMTNRNRFIEIKKIHLVDQLILIKVAAAKAPTAWPRQWLPVEARIV